MNLKVCISIVLFLFSGLVNAIALYTEKDPWEAALAGTTISLEDFEDVLIVEGISSYTTYDDVYDTEFNVNNLVTSSLSNLTFNNSQVFEEITELFDDGSTASTIWKFSSPIIAFGANWDLSPGNEGTGLAVSVDGQIIQKGSIPSNSVGEFWGIIAETPFLQIEISKPANIDGTELYHMDNLVFASPVPVPTAILLFGSAVFTLFGYKKRTLLK